MQQDPSSVPAFAYERFGDASRGTRPVEITQCTSQRLELTLRAQRMIDTPEFSAISYTWGDGKASRLVEVTVNGQTMLIMANCRYALEQAHALRRLPSPDLDYLWIVSICIDQGNSVEKRYRVDMMGRIFARAAKVVASLAAMRIIARILYKSWKVREVLTGTF